MHKIKGIEELNFRSFFSDKRGEFYEIWNDKSLKNLKFEQKNLVLLGLKKIL